MIPPRWSDAAPDLLPVLRGTWAPADAWRAGWRDPLAALPRVEVAPFLTALVVWDSPRERRYLQRRHLEAWGISMAEALGTALSHLPETDGLKRDGAIWRFKPGDGYATSRALLPGWLAAFEGEVPGPPLLAMPHARGVYIGGARDLRQVTALHEVAVEGFRLAGEPLSPALYTLGPGGGLVPWRPGPEHPLALSLALAEQRLALYACARQGQALAARGLPFAPLLALAPGDPRTFCDWAEGSAPLLPPADLVRLDAERLVPRSALALEPVEGHLPPRWRGVWPG